jgi:hypothetical protein
MIALSVVMHDILLQRSAQRRLISESFNLHLRAEFFNVLNRANFGAPVHNNTLFDQNEIRSVARMAPVDQTSTPAHQIQFALKMIWRFRVCKNCTARRLTKWSLWATPG